MFHLSQTIVVLLQQTLLLADLHLLVYQSLFLVQSHVLGDHHVFARLSLLHEGDLLAHESIGVALGFEILNVVILTSVVPNQGFTALLLLLGQVLSGNCCLLSAFTVLLRLLVSGPAEFNLLGYLKVSELLLS